MVKCAGVLLEPGEFPCDFLLVGAHEGLGIFDPIDTMEQVGNAAISSVSSLLYSQ
jgi:hypothetical protein